MAVPRYVPLLLWCVPVIDGAHRVVLRCNVEPEFPSFFGLTHANMVHVSDLRVLLTPDANHTDFKTVGFYSPVAQEPFYSGLGLFEMALNEWLPCFGDRL